MVSTVAGGVLSYIYTLALSRALPVSEYPVFAAGQAMLLVAGTVAGASAPWALSQRIAHSSGRHDRQQAVAFALLVNLAQGVLFAALIMGVAAGFAGSSTVLVLGASTIAIFLAATTVGLYQGLKRFGAIGWIRFLDVIVRCGVGIVFVAAGAGPWGALIGFGIGSLAMLLWGSRTLLSRLRLRFDALRSTSLWRQTIGLGAIQGFVAAFAGLDVVLVVLVGASSQAAGSYQLAMILGRIPLYISMALSMAAFPEITGTDASSQRVAQSNLRLYLYLAITGALVMATAPSAFLDVLFSGKYHDVGSLLPITVCTGVFIGALNLVTTYFQAIGRFRATVLVLAGAFVADAILMIGGFAAGSVHGLAVGAAIGAGVVTIFFVVRGQELWKLVNPSAVLRPALAALGALVVLSFASTWPAGWLAVAGITGLAGVVWAFRHSGLTARRFEWRSVTRVFVEHPSVTGILVAVIAFTLLAFRLRAAPDFVGDEMLYTRGAQQLLHDGALSWYGHPVFVHPPLYLLALAGWLGITGSSGLLTPEAIFVARFLTAIAAAGYVVTIWVLCRTLLPGARHRRIAVATVAAAIYMLDPLLLRYGRLVMIDSGAMFMACIGVLAAWTLRDRPFRIAVPALGIIFGLALLTKELTIFLLAAPLLWAVCTRQWALARKFAAAMGVATTFWLTLVLWALALGQVDAWTDEKLTTLGRLFGLIQVTGYNRPGVSLVASLQASASTYASSYGVLVLGGLAILWLLYRTRSRGEQYLMTVGFCGYAFAGFTVVQGQFNEQFLVYALPWGVVALVALCARMLEPDRLRRAARIGGVTVASFLALAILFGAFTWTRLYGIGSDRALQQVAAAVERRVPTCAVVNGTGSIETMDGVLPRRQITFFADGARARAAGVLWFLLSDKDARNRYGNMSPSLARWITAHGTQVVSHASRTYDNYALYYVASGAFDGTSGVTRTPAGAFVLASGAACGGYAVVDTPTSKLYSAYSQLGGKAELGRPISRGWTNSTGTFQAFDTVVLASNAQAARPVSVFPDLAVTDPEVLTRHHIPVPAGRGVVDANVAAELLTDPAIQRRYLGDDSASRSAALAAATARFGIPLTPPVEVRPGLVRQTFSAAVLEHRVGARHAHLASVGAVFKESGIVPTAAVARQTSPWGSGPQANDPSGIGWLLVALAAVLTIWLVVLARSVTKLRKRRQSMAPAALQPAGL